MSDSESCRTGLDHLRAPYCGERVETHSAKSFGERRNIVCVFNRLQCTYVEVVYVVGATQPDAVQLKIRPDSKAVISRET